MDSESQLILRIQSGDEAAFAQLYELLANSVYSLAFQLLKNREDAQEVLQDSFVKLHQTAQRFNPEFGSVRAYLYTIARNEARMRLRAKQSRPVKLAELDLHDTNSTFAAPEFDRDTPIIVATALNHLDFDNKDSYSDKALLEAAFFQGYSHQDIAKQSGLPLGTVKSRLRRALLKLREVLAHDTP